MTPSKTLALLLLILLTACTTPTNEPASPNQATEPPPAQTTTDEEDEEAVAAPSVEPPLQAGIAPAGAPLITTIIDFPDMKAGSVALTETGDIYVALGRDERIGLRYSVDGGATFSEAVRVNANAPAYLSSFAHPSITASDDGQVNVTWGQLASGTIGTIWYANSTDGGRTFRAPAMLMDPLLRTFAQRMSADDAQNPIVAWLENGRLRLARSLDGGTSFVHQGVVDTEVCDCCAPEPLVRADGVVYVAYRNLEYDDTGRAIRDIYLSRSTDDGATFAPEVRVSDAPWYIESCPVNGPSLAIAGEQTVLTWIDGRNDTAGTLAQTDLFVSISTDGGQTFSSNIQINAPASDYHSTPAIALGAEGRIHLSWSVFSSTAQALYYAYSDDEGATFTEPLLMASSADDTERGRPETQKLVVDGSGRVYLMWADKLGVHLAILEASPE